MLSQVRSGAHRLLHPVGPDPRRRWCRSPRSTASASRSRTTTSVWPAMDGELGALRPRRRSPRPASSPSTRCGTTASARSPASPSRSTTPDDLKGFKIRVPVEPAVDLDVQGVRRRADRRSTSPRSTPRCRPRWSTARRTRSRSSRPPSSTKCRNTARMTNHMWDGFWLLANRQALGAAAGRTCARSSRSDVNAAALEAARGHGQAERDAARRSSRSKGMAFNSRRHRSRSATAAEAAGFYEEWQGKSATRPGTHAGAAARGKLA